ncbi:hypothetical protein LCM23_13330 [Cytobacillus kochii]|uniref:hypothetical protein n=1 Tax=Cytobacillus kochii TaxID=859143 RepID=UPI001CD71A77|nr:hypothetical protein [Cytobacillus kochii]MCA1027078.1 hypothetical protein [Cytobacillus kochii]
MLKLFTYQKELANAKEREIEINWCRGAGKRVGVAVYILENKPKTVLFSNMKHQYNSLIDTFKWLQNFYKFEIVGNALIFKDEVVRLHTPDIKSEGKVYDLYVVEKESYLEPSDYKRKITVSTKNVSELKRNPSVKYIDVDYKMAIENGALKMQTVVDCLLDSSRDHFYNSLAILDKPTFNMSLESFSKVAIQRLQKQYLDIQDRNDTVLTRKDLLAMIRELTNFQKR